MVIANPKNQQIELQVFLERLADATEPRPANIVELRIDERLSRTLPALVIPWGNNGPAIDQAMFVVTKNLSTAGAALISQSAFDVDELLVGLWHKTECRFIKGLIRYHRQIEGGFSQLGVELERIVDPREFPALERLANLVEQLK